MSDRSPQARISELAADTTLPAATTQKALLYVASSAHDADDLRLLMDALGLNGRPMRSSAKLRSQQGVRHARKLDQP